MNKLYIVKIGASVLDHPSHLSSFLEDFRKIPEAKILVHGGGAIATHIGNKMGISSRYVDGRRITDDDTLDLVTMVYAGLINKKLVATLQSLGCNALGLSGADANIIPARKRGVAQLDYGWVGDITASGLNTSWLVQQLEYGICPVIAPITHDGNGNLLNTNADSIAAALAVAFSDHYAVELIFGFDKPGVLLHPNDEHSVIQSMNKAAFLNLKATEQIYAGMIPKLENAFHCIDAGVRAVQIGKAEHLNSLLLKTEGTTLS